VARPPVAAVSRKRQVGRRGVVRRACTMRGNGRSYRPSTVSNVKEALQISEAINGAREAVEE